MLRGEAARLSGTDMPDDHHPLMPRRNPEDIGSRGDQDRFGVPDRTGHAIPQGASSKTRLYDDRERRDRHRLDRAFWRHCL